MEKTQSLKKFDEELENYRKGGNFNVLVPTTTIQEISPFHKPILEKVTIDPDPKKGEVYEPVYGSGDFSFRASALQKFSFAAGLIWNARGCRRTDDGSNDDIVSYSAEAAVRKEDGTYILLNAEYMLDLKIIEMELRTQYEKKADTLISDGKLKKDGRGDYIKKNLDRDILQKRKFRLQLAQTGAMDRVIRKILGLKGTYRKEELEKPFIVPKIAFSPDVSDPRIRDAMIKRGVDATSILFGPSETNLIDHIAGKGDIIDVTSPVSDSPPESGAADTAAGEPARSEPWEKMSKDDQVKYLQDLIKRKDFPQNKLTRPLSEFSEQHRKALYDHLMTLPGKDDLPFQI